MNRLIYVLLISALTISGFIMYREKDLGHISFNFADISFETNLLVFGSAVLCCLFLILVMFRSYEHIKHLFIELGSKRQHRLEDKARLSLSRGLIEYAEGRFEQAERALLQHVKYSNNRLPVYLSAARAAQQLGAHERRDDYLQKALLEAPDANVAIGLTKAELQLAHTQNEQALATLIQLNSLRENHPYVLTLLANTYQHLQDWNSLHNILPQLKKHANLSAESFRSFEIRVCKGQLTDLTKTAVAARTGSGALIDYWNNVSPHLQLLAEVLEHYARQLIQVNAAGEAEKVLRLFLNRQWCETTIILYSELDVMVDSRQLEIAEGWLKDHQQNAYLLLALGKMCIARSLWGKARSYLEASLSVRPMPESYLKLARLLEEYMNEQATAQEYYRQGLHLLVGDYGADILQKGAHDFERETPQLKIVKS